MNDEKNILNEDDELQKIAPLLSAVSSMKPYTTPEGYFEALPQIIIAKCKIPSTDKKKVWGLSMEYRIAMIVSTVFVIITLAAFFLFINPRRLTQIKKINSTALVPDEKLMNDLSDDFEESTIVDAVLSGSPENSFDSGNLDNDDFLTENGEYTEDDIIDYLLNSNTEMDLMTQ